VSKNSKKNVGSNRACRELIRILEEAVQFGATDIELEYEVGDLVVYYIVGGTGIGDVRVPKQLQGKVLDEIVRRANLSDNFRGRMQVVLLGKDYDVIATMRESFGEWAFNLALRERKRR
jgi:hypothetical protein